MCIFQIHVRCDGFSEILCDEVENAELVVEDVMCHVLLNLFNGGTVEDITVRRFVGSSLHRPGCSIQIRVQCPCLGCSLEASAKEPMQREMQKHTALLLRELFTSVEVDDVSLSPVGAA